MYVNNDVSRVIHKRKTVRSFRGNTLKLRDLCQILFDAYSKKASVSYTIPQAGGLEVMSLTVLFKVKGMWEVYNYDSIKYQLNKVNKLMGSIDTLFYTKSVNFTDATSCIIITCDLESLSKQYLTRAFKFACIQAGHIAQNILLRANLLNLYGITLGSLVEGNIIKQCVIKDPYLPLYCIIF